MDWVKSIYTGEEGRKHTLILRTEQAVWHLRQGNTLAFAFFAKVCETQPVREADRKLVCWYWTSDLQVPISEHRTWWEAYHKLPEEMRQQAEAEIKEI